MNFMPAAFITEGDERTLGVRPEDLSLQADGGLAATIQHVEQLGGYTNVIARVKDTQITARLFGQHAISQGQSVTFGYSPEKAFYFDREGLRA